jgi:hypothetical protein
MKINKPGAPKNKGRSVKEDLQRLDDAGINLGTASDEESKPKEEKGIPDTKKQQQTGETTRSDRRL